MKFSRKDLLLLLGVAIAIIVLFTTAFFGGGGFYPTEGVRTFQQAPRAMAGQAPGFFMRIIDRIGL